MIEDYVYLSKNLRGVLALSGEDDVESIVKWLSRKFRYRDIGVPESLVESNEDVFSGKLSGNPFYKLRCELDFLEKHVGCVREYLVGIGVERSIADAVVLATCYVCPILSTTRVVELLVERGLALKVLCGAKLDDKQAKLHIRIANYSVLDSLRSHVGEACKCLSEGLGGDWLRSRRVEWCERDSRRYWRFREGGEKIIAYIDYTPKLIEEKPKLAMEIADSNSRILLAPTIIFNLESIQA